MTDQSDTPGFEFRLPPDLVALTPAAFAAVDDADLESATVGFVAGKLGAAESELAGLQQLPEFVRNWYLAFVVDAEVLNGGLNQYFFNPSGVQAEFAPAAFEAIGAPAAAEIILEALMLLGEHAPAIEAAHADGTLEAFLETYIDQPFSALDERYGAMEDELRDARIRYLRSHAARVGNS